MSEATSPIAPEPVQPKEPAQIKTPEVGIDQKLRQVVEGNRKAGNLSKAERMLPKDARARQDPSNPNYDPRANFITELVRMNMPSGVDSDTVYKTTRDMMAELKKIGVQHFESDTDIASIAKTYAESVLPKQETNVQSSPVAAPAEIILPGEESIGQTLTRDISIAASRTIEAVKNKTIDARDALKKLKDNPKPEPVIVKGPVVTETPWAVNLQDPNVLPRVAVSKKKLGVSEEGRKINMILGNTTSDAILPESEAKINEILSKPLPTFTGDGTAVSNKLSPKDTSPTLVTPPEFSLPQRPDFKMKPLPDETPVLQSKQKGIGARLQSVTPADQLKRLKFWKKEPSPASGTTSAIDAIPQTAAATQARLEPTETPADVLPTQPAMLESAPKDPREKILHNLNIQSETQYDSRVNLATGPNPALADMNHLSPDAREAIVHGIYRHDNETNTLPTAELSIDDLAQLEDAQMATEPHEYNPTNQDDFEYLKYLAGQDPQRITIGDQVAAKNEATQPKTAPEETFDSTITFDQLREAEKDLSTINLDVHASRYRELLQQKQDPKNLAPILDHLNQLVDAIPNSPSLRRALGDAYMRMGRFQKAIEQYNMAVNSQQTVAA